jgi:arylsulfatase A-like enzyme
VSRGATLARTTLATFVAALAAGAVGCGGDDGKAGTPPPRVGRYDSSGRLVEGKARGVAAPNIVLLCMDTVRRDATEPADGGGPIMPNLAAWEKASTRFVDAAASATWTAPSVATMLTGLSPWKHGVHGHLHAPPLVPAVATVAEALRAAGYATAAFTGGGWVSDSQGFGQGFDSWRENWSYEDPGGGLARFLAARDKTKPLFLFLHTYEAHEPYGRKLPQPEGEDDPAKRKEVGDYVERLAAMIPGPDDPVPDSEAKRIAIALHSEPLLQQALFRRFGRERMQRLMFGFDGVGFRGSADRKQIEDVLRARYRAGLALLDASFGSLVRKLDAAMPAGTATLVTSDHGESLGEHDDLGHGRSLYDVLQRVHLAIRAPGRVPASAEVRGSCGLVDVMPTILDLAGLPMPSDADGRSLLPFARGESAPEPIEGEEWRRDAEPARLVEERIADARTETAKLVIEWSSETGNVTERLFDLVADPGETHALDAKDVARFGESFARAADSARRRVAGWRSKALPPEDGR